ncbi:hypothetical protein TRIP_B350006 [uncultured Desulfatiglans sp.]|uniref:Uncharacterized protein n=1 Tax=Uncultured Desulfatiglans sp. TaxID=1748965 RepID=A0A653AAW5_UNCDX|nr:hypothetical protein TRIP_B350006 [uncultured Desulfatiglans sp.]
MQDEKEVLIVLAALLHDTGKLFERGPVSDLGDAHKDNDYLSMCREDGKGHHTHLHSAYTRAFCDWLEDKFSCLKASAHKDWKIWCAAHHRNDESGLEATVVRIADRLSSSEREEGQYYVRKVHQRTLLEPVLERVFLGRNEKTFTILRYPLRRLSADRDGLFPLSASDLNLKEGKAPGGGVQRPSEWAHLLSEQPMEAEYRALGEALLADMEALSEQRPEIPLLHLLETLFMLLERYTANVPAATNVRHPDISLFDHLRTTAAIAQALMLEHAGRGAPRQGIQTKDDPKWLLVCGDFSGIQRFIYNLTNKGAAKGLRGRSFYVQYFCRLAADFILRELGMTRAGLLYNSGGKFYLLIPARLEESLRSARAKVNRWLLEAFEGEVFLGLGTANVTGAQFSQGRMQEAWDEAARSLERDRRTRFREHLSPEFFAPRTDFNPVRSCEVCGTRNIAPDKTRCDACNTLQDLGKALKTAEALLTIWGDPDCVTGVAKRLGVMDSAVVFFDGFGAGLIVLTDEQFSSLKRLEAFDGECAFLNQTGERPLAALSLPPCSLGAFYLGRWGAEHGGFPDFEDFADQSQGLRRLGVLRMDVDNLGAVFIEGLRFPERSPVTVDGEVKDGWGDVVLDKETGAAARKPMASISRMVTLSRQLNHFFSGYVPRLLEEEPFRQCRVVYAGGDDLFIIGSWHQLPDLAQRIHDDFQVFCCGNPDLSISGGITMQRGKFPIYKGALMAGKAEEKAKTVRSSWAEDRDPLHKDGFCFLDVAVPWEDLAGAREIGSWLEADIAPPGGKPGDRGLLSFLMRTAEVNRGLVRRLMLRRSLKEPEAWRIIAYEAWRWRTAYQLKRRYGKDQDGMITRWAEKLFPTEQKGAGPVLPVYTWLELPLRWADYLHRKGDKS